MKKLVDNLCPTCKRPLIEEAEEIDEAICENCKTPFQIGERKFRDHKDADGPWLCFSCVVKTRDDPPADPLKPCQHCGLSTIHQDHIARCPSKLAAKQRKKAGLLEPEPCEELLRKVPRIIERPTDSGERTPSDVVICEICARDIKTTGHDNECPQHAQHRPGKPEKLSEQFSTPKASEAATANRGEADVDFCQTCARDIKATGHDNECPEHERHRPGKELVPSNVPAGMEYKPGSVAQQAAIDAHYSPSEMCDKQAKEIVDLKKSLKKNQGEWEQYNEKQQAMIDRLENNNRAMADNNGGLARKIERQKIELHRLYEARDRRDNLVAALEGVVEEQGYEIQNLKAAAPLPIDKDAEQRVGKVILALKKTNSLLSELRSFDPFYKVTEPCPYCKGDAHSGGHIYPCIWARVTDTFGNGEAALKGVGLDVLLADRE